MNHTAPYRHVPFPPLNLELLELDDDALLIREQAPLTLIAETIVDGILQRADKDPNKPAFMERQSNGEWGGLTFAELKVAILAAAQWFLDQGANAETPIMFVSGNSVAHAVLRLAALAVGAPICPVSENYALLGASSDYARLRHALNTIQPKFVFAENGRFANALSTVNYNGAIIAKTPEAFGNDAIDFGQILTTPATNAVEQRHAKIDLDAPAALILTSGSTGAPKAVIHTHANMISGVSQSAWLLNSSGAWSDKQLEWLPWSHVSGLYVSMAAPMLGGSFYIDGGRPLPGLFDQTLTNIRDLSLKSFTNVPAGYAMLAQAMDEDEALRNHFFSNMSLLVFGGAALPQPIFDKLQSQAIAVTGQRVLIISGYGATETTTGCMSARGTADQPGIGLPLPGVDLKLIPNGHRYEVRLRGPMICAGYLNQPELTNAMLDAEGFYLTDDTAEFIDPDNPEAGFKFAGRLKEDFKLVTGTWVLGGALRTDILKALGDQVSEVLVCGENKNGVGILAWPAPGRAIDLDDIRQRLVEFNENNGASSRRITRFALLSDAPNAAAGELSDKGSVNQALAIKNRQNRVDALYTSPAPEGVLEL